MSEESPLDAAVRLVGLQKLATELRLSWQAVQKWRARGRMPRTEWTGETAYAEKIEELTAGRVTKAALLGAWPAVEGARALPVKPSEHAAALQLDERRHADRRHAFEPPRDGHWKRAKGRDRRRGEW